MKEMWKSCRLPLLLFCMSLFGTVFAQQEKMSAYTKMCLSVEEKSPLAKSVSPRVGAFVFVEKGTDSETFSRKYEMDVRLNHDSVWVVDVPLGQLEQLAQDSAVLYIEAGMPVKPSLSVAKTLGNVDKVLAGEQPLPKAFDGSGVLVGIVDFGFQYDHVDFYSAEDNYQTTRIKSVYDVAANKSYDTQEEMETLRYDYSQENAGHGTHVAGTAAGSFADASSGTDYSGVAPGADLVFCSIGASGTTTSVLTGLQYALACAEYFNQPLVVNLSLGEQVGPHDGMSTFDVTCDNLMAEAGNGIIFVGAAGNEGNSPIYTEANLSAGASAVRYIDASKIKSETNGTVDIWGNAGQKYAISLVFSDLSGNVKVEQSISRSSGTFSSTVFGDYASGKIEYAKASGRYNGKNNVLLRLQDFSLESGCKFGIRITATDAGVVRAWCNSDNSSVVWEGETSASYTVGEIGGTGKNMITVGSYNSTFSPVGGISSFSSQGPTADGRIKPDVVAPGYSVLSSLSDNATASGRKTCIFEGKTYYFAPMAGTSMSTAYVSGVLALWLQAEPTLTPERVRDIFAHSCQTESAMGSLPNNTWGYGKIDAYAGLVYLLKTASAVEKVADEKSVMFYSDENSARILFLNDEERVSVEVYDIRGALVWSEKAKNTTSGTEIILPINDYPLGIYIVRVATNGCQQTFKVINK